MLLNGKQVHELSTICHASKVRDRAKAVVFKLKNELPRQQFAIAIQVPPSPLSSHNIKIKMQNHHRQDYDQTQTPLKLLQIPVLNRYVPTNFEKVILQCF